MHLVIDITALSPYADINASSLHLDVRVSACDHDQCSLVEKFTKIEDQRELTYILVSIRGGSILQSIN